ncbi:TnsA endonuclease N-terminal domain-containing protein [Chitiniphilus purpureus]|uniref:TnsA endonuclease N-terminal domain-containing protein n=1 Tax=Chitiniphilus purpureus TaxID=2981137 RepID=A0ABY6DQY6_9NEIS|nr:TnsA endonuclease N-terminal domain-containing protein [Chitiniphilus sp. CD1]UXY16638.1 TnsA endonuclease N-terminal domain-containing protein [Chitiniphilus sp. CD1]
MFSDVEHRLFFMLEWQRDVVDVREQFPLDRELTLAVASSLGLRHPYYPGTGVPTVMTVDFMVTRVVDGEYCYEAYDAKRAEDAADQDAMDKLKIQSVALQLMTVPHTLVFHTQIPLRTVRNIQWIRNAAALAGDGLPPNELDRHKEIFAKQLCGQRGRQSFFEFCRAYDNKYDLPRESAFRLGCWLLQFGLLSAELGLRRMPDVPISSFVLNQDSMEVRHAG